MLNMTHLFIPMEIFFWNACIYLMSESRFVRFIIRESYQIVEGKAWRKILAQTIALASIGLTIGFGMGYLSALVR